MSPKECRMYVNTEFGDGFPDGQFLDHPLGVVDMLVRHTETGQRRSRQGVERLAALRFLALETLAPVLAASLGDIHAAAVRAALHGLGQFCHDDGTLNLLDRKSTRLNSSHHSISYAVFCLKKKKKK